MEAFAALAVAAVVGLLSFGGAVLSINANIRATGQGAMIDDLQEQRKLDREEMTRLGREVGHLRREVRQCESEKRKLRQELAQLRGR